MTTSSFYPDQRETKYVLRADQAHAVWGTVASHMRSHRSQGVRWVRTTYFDTQDLVFCRSLQTPIARRLRVREYSPTRDADDVGPVHCYLELKQSSEGQRSKLRLRQTSAEIYETLATLTTGRLAPVVASQYRRAAVADDGEVVRITLDDEISFCRAVPIGSPFAAPNARDVLARGPEFVLEIKLRGQRPAWLAQLDELLPEPRPFSKFETGIAAATPPGLAMDAAITAALAARQ